MAVEMEDKVTETTVTSEESKSKKSGPSSWLNAYVMTILRTQCEAAKRTTEIVLNTELAKYGEHVDFKNHPYILGERDYTWGQNGTTKQLDHVLEDAVVLDVEGEVVRRIKADIEIESNMRPKESVRMSGYALSASSKLDKSEDGFDTYMAPMQIVVALRLPRKNDPKVIGYNLHDYRGEMTVKYRVPVIYLGETREGTIFDPLCVAGNNVTNPTMMSEAEWSDAFVCSVKSVVDSIDDDRVAREAISCLLDGLNQRRWLGEGFEAAYTAAIEKEVNEMNNQLREQRSLREIYADYLIGPNAVREAAEKAAREAAQKASQEAVKEERENTVVRLIDLGHSQDSITEVYGPDIWTPQLLAYLEMKTKGHDGQTSTRTTGSLSRMDFDKRN